MSVRARLRRDPDTASTDPHAWAPTHGRAAPRSAKRTGPRWPARCTDIPTMADSNDRTIHPKPWPADVGEALPGAALPRQWVDDETPPPTKPEPKRRAAGKRRKTDA